MYIKDITFKMIKSTRKLRIISCELELRQGFLNKKQKAKTKTKKIHLIMPE